MDTNECHLSADPVLVEHTKWAARRGLFTPALHRPGQQRPDAGGSLSDTSDADLSDAFAAWTSEAHRLCELNAAISGRRTQLGLAVQRARARAAVDVRDGDGKPSVAEVADRVCLDADVQTCEDALTDLEVVAAFVSGQREACEAHLTLLSREITHRVSLKTARLV